MYLRWPSGSFFLRIHFPARLHYIRLVGVYRRARAFVRVCVCACVCVCVHARHKGLGCETGTRDLDVLRRDTRDATPERDTATRRRDTTPGPEAACVRVGGRAGMCISACAFVCLSVCARVRVRV